MKLAIVTAYPPSKVTLNEYAYHLVKHFRQKVAAALGLMLPYVCKLKKIPNIVLLHNILEEVDLGSAGFTSNKVLTKLYSFIGTTLTKLILKADVVAVTMQKYVTILENKYNVKNVKLIPHGTFEIPKEPNYITPSDPMQIMAFGKFGTYKKVEAMIEAVEKVRKSTDLNLEVVIAGEDNPNVPGYLAQVKEAYKDVPQIRFTGYVEENEVPVLFNESTVVVFPYTSTTGSSGVLHQAGSYGKAVIMPDLGDLALLVKDEGYQGEFFDPKSVDSLAKAIESIVTNNDYKVKLGQINYKAATAHPMSDIADMYLNTFKAVGA